MSHAQYASRPFPVFAKLAVMLRNIPAMQFIFAKVTALLRSDKRSDESLISKFLGETLDVARNAVDQNLAVLKPPGDFTIAAPRSSDQSDREKLIRQRWSETGIKMWNPNIHGAGHAALNIQGQVELLPVKPGETRARYDKLEFNLVGGRIVCEGVVVDPRKR